MAVFSVKVNRSKIVDEFVSQVSARLLLPNVVKNPFEGKIKVFPKDDKELIVVSLKPIYPSIWLVGLVFIVPCLVWFSWWLFVPGLIFFCLSFFWSSPFFYIIFYRGLRRSGYKGSIKLLSHDNSLRWIIGAD